jgi:hypothetical protein
VKDNVEVESVSTVPSVQSAFCAGKVSMAFPGAGPLWSLEQPQTANIHNKVNLRIILFWGISSSHILSRNNNSTKMLHADAEVLTKKDPERFK